MSKKHSGRIAQTFIYVGKLFRMFIFRNDWKVLPMAAIIAALVSYVISGTVFKTMEGTLQGTFALSCICIWNGFFNSIQSVCREREIVKREHRAGLHMSSYVAAQMIYQLLLCLAQTVVTMITCSVAGVKLPVVGVVTRWGLVDTGITILLTTYAADMMALMVSCIVKSTTTAMTTMPFLLLFQLVFSGGFFTLDGIAEKIQYVTMSHWGMNSLCAIGRYNDQPMVSLWNMLVRFEDIEILGHKPLNAILLELYNSGAVLDLQLWSGKQNQVAEFASTTGNVLHFWAMLVILLLVFAVASVIALEFIDRDKR